MEKLIEELNNPQINAAVMLQIVEYGEKAIEPLVRFLLSPPTIFFQPKCLAAEALGIIGGSKATEGLIKVLNSHNLESLDPVVQLSAEAVRNRVAQQLEILGDRRAIEPLLEALRRDHLGYAAMALARFREKRAIPYIIDCLEDDYARETASKALIKFGEDAVLPLIESLSTRKYYFVNETGGSIERRTESARLLGEIGDKRTISPLLKALGDKEEKVRLMAALSLVRLSKNTDERKRAIPQLLVSIESSSWYFQMLCIEALSELGNLAVPYIERALQAGFVETIAGERVTLSDVTLQTLKRFQSKALVKE